MRDPRQNSRALLARNRRQARLRLAQRLLRSRDLRVLGHGAYATAFAIGRHHVLKVADAEDRAALWCRARVGRHPNIHWPRIYKVMRTPRHTVFWMERLWPLVPFAPKRPLRRRGLRKLGGSRVAQADGAVELLTWCRSIPLEYLLKHPTGISGKWRHCPPTLRRPLLAYHQAAEFAGFARDSKREAFMWRPGGVLVWADPFVARD